MPLLIAPVFNSTTPHSVRIDMPNSYTLVSGAKKPYQVAARYLRNEMDENRRLFDKRVDQSSLFLVGDYPEMRLTDDRDWIEEIENKLNLASINGICSIPYVITAKANLFGITYLKRSLDGAKYLFDQQAQRIFLALLERELPKLAFRRYSLSLEKKSYEDQLLDLWIGLESLFVPDGKKGEITYKLRLRMAYYFGESLKQREQIAQLIKTSYNHRSEIVHSGKVFGSALTNEVNTLRLMARAAILNVAMEEISLQDLRVRLDQLMLTGDSYYGHYQPPFFERINL